MENIAGVLLTQKNEVARGGFQMVDSAFANSGLLLSPSSGVSSMATGGVRSCEPGGSVHLERANFARSRLSLADFANLAN